jgi:hypothetical protein
VHNDSEEVIKPICIIHVVDGIKEAQLKWERDAVRQLDKPDLRLLTVFLVFKALKMQCEDVWEFLDLHPRPKYNQHPSTYSRGRRKKEIPLLGLLEVAAGVAEEFVLVA